MPGILALASGSPALVGQSAVGGLAGQSAAGYLGAAVLRGLLAMSVSRSLDSEERRDASNGSGAGQHHADTSVKPKRGGGGKMH